MSGTRSDRAAPSRALMARSVQLAVPGAPCQCSISPPSPPQRRRWFAEMSVTPKESVGADWSDDVLDLSRPCRSGARSPGGTRLLTVPVADGPGVGRRARRPCLRRGPRPDAYVRVSSAQGVPSYAASAMNCWSREHTLSLQAESVSWNRSPPKSRSYRTCWIDREDRKWPPRAMTAERSAHPDPRRDAWCHGHQPTPQTARRLTSCSSRGSGRYGASRGEAPRLTRCRSTIPGLPDGLRPRR